MELGKKIAKVAVTGALLLSAMLPAFAQTYTTREYRDSNGNVVVRRTVVGPNERIVTTRRHHRRYYHRNFHPMPLYMTPYSTRRYHYDNDGRRYYNDSDGIRHYR